MNHTNTNRKGNSVELRLVLQLTFTGLEANQSEEEKDFANHCDEKGSDTDDFRETDADTEGAAMKESISASEPMTDAQVIDHEVAKHKRFLLRW